MEKYESQNFKKYTILKEEKNPAKSEKGDKITKTNQVFKIILKPPIVEPCHLSNEYHKLILGKIGKSKLQKIYNF